MEHTNPLLQHYKMFSTKTSEMKRSKYKLYCTIHS
jgi:hypothetical protein